MIYSGIIVSVCAAETFLRHMANEKLSEDTCREVRGLPIFLQKYHNYGMAENRLQEKPKAVKTIGVIVLGILTVIFLLTLPFRGKKVLKAGLALVLGGGLSNLAERFVHGYVTDYFRLKVPFPRIRRLIFNVADFCIFIGAALVVFSQCGKQ